MIKWIKHASPILEHFEYTRDNLGRFAGYVSRFKEGPAYAWTLHAKVGEYQSIGEAKDAIEKLLRKKK